MVRYPQSSRVPHVVCPGFERRSPNRHPALHDLADGILTKLIACPMREALIPSTALNSVAAFSAPTQRRTRKAPGRLSAGTPRHSRSLPKERLPNTGV